MTELQQLIKDYEDLGAIQCHLGIAEMPEGYALMMDADRMYYFWLCEDGTESVIHWDRWAIWRGAKKHAARRKQHAATM